MAVTVVDGVEGVQGLVGATIGPGEWTTPTSAQVAAFLDSAGPQPGPADVVPPFLLLSLVSRLVPDLLTATGFRMGVNYGTDRVRFPAAAPVGARLRCSLTVDRVDEIAAGVAMWSTVTFEAEGVAEPVMVAVVLVRRYL